MRENTGLKEEIGKGRFIVVMLDDQKRGEEVAEIANALDSESRICYVCISRTHDDVRGDLKKYGADLNKFYFIDTLSSHFKKMKDTNSCRYLDSPSNLPSIKSEIAKAIAEKKCTTLILDTVSTMLIYHDCSNIVRFTYDLLSEDKKRERILYIATKQDADSLEDNGQLIEDIRMFADKLLDISSKKSL